MSYLPLLAQGKGLIEAFLVRVDKKISSCDMSGTIVNASCNYAHRPDESEGAIEASFDNCNY